MRRNILTALILLALPLTLLPIILGAVQQLEQERRQYFMRMRQEHLRSIARDERRRAERARLHLIVPAPRSVQHVTERK